MSGIVFVDGAYRRRGEPLIQVEDRGFQFADGVYEVWFLVNGRLADADAHMKRLGRSLEALKIAPPMSEAALSAVIEETRRRNRVRNGVVYVQITRGAAPRDHAFPRPGAPATLVVMVKPLDLGLLDKRAERGIEVITHPDERWTRCNIKSVSLLPNVLAKQAAREAGATEAILVDDEGIVTEGASSTFWIVDADGTLRTHPLSPRILPGVTRARVAELAAGLGVAVREEAFTVETAAEAREAFITSASQLVMPVTKIDGRAVGGGEPGPTSKALRAAYRAALNM